MELFAIPVDVIISSITGVFSLVGLAHQLRSTNAIHELREKMVRIERKRNTNTAIHLDDPHQFADVLQDAQLIASNLSRRIFSRFVFVLFAILTTFFAVQYDGEGSIPRLGEHIELCDLGFLAVQALATVRFWIIDKDERIFLNNLSALEEIFHRHCVVPAIEQFNKSIESNAALQRELKEQKAIVARIARFMWK